MTWQLFAVGTRYGRGTLMGFSRRWERKVTNPKILGRAIAEELVSATEVGEGLEIEVQR